MDNHRVRGFAVAALAAIGVFGLNSMFGQIYRNGYIAQLRGILAASAPVLPGSQSPLLTRYLGLSPVDRLLAVAAVLWANVTDGTAPELSLYAFQFGGQLVPIFLAIMIEGSRSGNARNLLTYTVLWGYAMQTFGYALTMPLFGILHLLRSPACTSSSQALANPSLFDPRVLLPAFGLGYFVPSVLMSLPMSPAAHQWFGAIWQGFPLYVIAYQALFVRLVKPSPQNDAKSLAHAYDWGFNVAAVTQLCTYAVLQAVRVAPSLFPSWAPTAFTFGSVFRPGPMHSTEPLSSMAAAMHDFFKWDQYVGSAAAMTWALAQYAISAETELTLQRWANLGWDILRWSLVAGPAGALMQVLKRRDEAILCNSKKSS